MRRFAAVLAVAILGLTATATAAQADTTWNGTHAQTPAKKCC